MNQRFLNPSVLASISGLELVAKTVVQGFVSGLHRSPDFGFSQEFAEYRMYSEGDDLRHVDWNVFARTERAYLKRYRGETNTLLTILLDASASMSFGSHALTKINYARYLAASLCYLGTHGQRDATGLLVFDDEIRGYVPPSSRQGQLARLFHVLDKAEPGARTDFAKPFIHCQQFLHRKGIIVVISDFYEDPEKVVKAVEALRFHGNEVILFHILDPQEIRPKIKNPVLMLDLETQEEVEVSPEYFRHEYAAKIDAHVEDLKDRSKRSGLDYMLLDTGRPLDGALREYLSRRLGRN